jgi:hypothetical protein
MIDLAAAAVLLRDLTEQRLDGADGSAPARRSRQAPSNASAPAGESRGASGQCAASGPSRTLGARQGMPRSA